MKILHIEGGRNFYGGSLQVMYLIKGLEKRKATLGSEYVQKNLVNFK